MCFDKDISNIKSQYNLILVCGPYKAGTSLVTRYFEKAGYYNPSTLTNNSEMGHGTNGFRYKTRECSVARSVNNEFLLGKDISSKYIFKGIKGYLKILKNYNVPAVLKIPNMIYTINYWHDLSITEGLQPFVVVCNRPIDELKEAWKRAPWTKNKLYENQNYPERMLNDTKDMVERLVITETPHQVIQFSMIKNYFSEEYCERS